MQNENIKVGQLVPKKIRLQVYKEARTIVESGRARFGMPSNQLCLVLPCVLWQLKHYLDDGPEEKAWCPISDVPGMFPEMTEDVIKSITDAGFGNYDEVRLRVLTKFIQELLPKPRTIKKTSNHA